VTGAQGKGRRIDNRRNNEEEGERRHMVVAWLEAHGDLGNEDGRQANETQ
jgi:hypothetical protein